MYTTYLSNNFSNFPILLLWKRIPLWIQFVKKILEKYAGLPLTVFSKSSIWFDKFATMNHFYHDIYVFGTKIDTRCQNINYIDYLRKNINLYISPGPGSGRYAVKKTFFDIYNHLVLVLVHLFPEYFDFLLLRSVCGSV